MLVLGCWKSSFLPLKPCSDFIKDRVYLWKFLLVSLSIFGFFQYLQSFLSQQVNFALTCLDHYLLIFPINIINVCNTMISMLPHSTTEAYTYLAISTITLNIFTCMVPACFIASALASSLHLFKSILSL